MKKRTSVQKTFYNEILHSDDEVIDTKQKSAKKGCFGKSHLQKVLEKGREMQARELNVTRFIQTARNGNVMQNMSDPTQTLFTKASKRYIDVNPDPRKQATYQKYRTPILLKLTA